MSGLKTTSTFLIDENGEKEYLENEIEVLKSFVGDLRKCVSLINQHQEKKVPLNADELRAVEAFYCMGRIATILQDRSKKQT